MQCVSRGQRGVAETRVSPEVGRSRAPRLTLTGRQFSASPGLLVARQHKHDSPPRIPHAQTWKRSNTLTTFNKINDKPKTRYDQTSSAQQQQQRHARLYKRYDGGPRTLAWSPVKGICSGDEIKDEKQKPGSNGSKTDGSGDNKTSEVKLVAGDGTAQIGQPPTQSVETSTATGHKQEVSASSVSVVPENNATNGEVCPKEETRDLQGTQNRLNKDSKPDTGKTRENVKPTKDPDTSDVTKSSAIADTSALIRSKRSALPVLHRSLESPIVVPVHSQPEASSHRKFDNPRYRIPASRGRNRTLSDSVLQDHTRNERKKVDSLPVTLLDVAHAASDNRPWSVTAHAQPKEREWLFNTDADVQRFRKLLRSPSPIVGAEKYCNREKTRWIVSWLRDVEQTQGQEGMFDEHKS